MKSGYATVFLVLILLATSQWGCKNNIVGTTAPATATLSGIVVASNSGTAIEGATVLLTYGSTSDSVVTGSDGTFYFVIDVADTSKGVDVTLTVRGTGYVTFSRTFNVKTDQTFPVSLSINPAAYAVLSGVVQDSLSQYPQGGASVIVSLPGPSSSTMKSLGYSASRVKSVSSVVIDSTTTLANGSFIMNINLYTLTTLSAVMTVSKAGFVTYQTNLTLTRGSSQNIVVPLQQDKSQSVAHVVGQVTDGRSQMPITNATVIMTTSLKKDSARTLNDGSYSFDINLPGATSSVSGTLLFRLSSYNDTTINFTAGAGQTVTKNAALSAKPTVVGGDSNSARGVAQSFYLMAGYPQPNELSIHGVGGNETSVLVWQVLDSLGFPLDVNHKYGVSFQLSGAPALGGAYVSPTVDSTNAQGQVGTKVNSGTVAGTIQVVASLTRKDGSVVQSMPVKIVVDGGFPDQSHFSLGVNELNFAGYDWIDRTNGVYVDVGDMYANPVYPGTAIYFTTTAAKITPAGYTNNLGQASATLLSGNPLAHTPGLDTTLFGSANDPLLPLLDKDYGYPNDPSYFGGGTGYGWVKASTRDGNGAVVQDSELVCFSAATAPILLNDSLTISPVTVTLNTGSITIPVHISDRFGNPLESGTTITVTVSIPPSLGGNVTNVYSANSTGLPSTLGDHLTRGFGKTDFTLNVSIAQIQGNPTPTQFGVTIKVNGRNGTRETSFSGVAVP